MSNLSLKEGIIIPSQNSSPELARDAIDVKNQVLKVASTIGKVTSLPSEKMAVEALTLVQGLRRGMEKCRKERKEKPLSQCREIDALAKSYDDELVQAELKIKKELGDYAEIKRKEAEEEERVRQAELRKIEEERRKKEEEAERAARAQAEAEAEIIRQKKAAENAKTEKARQEARKLADEAARRVAEEAAKLNEATKAAESKLDEIRESLPVVAQKASGAATKFVYKYEVLNINDLFAHAPHVVELSEKKSSVNALINGMAMANPNEIPKIPGLKVWREADVTTRSR